MSTVCTFSQIAFTIIVKEIIPKFGTKVLQNFMELYLEELSPIETGEEY